MRREESAIETAIETGAERTSVARSGLKVCGDDVTVALLSRPLRTQPQVQYK